MPSFLLSLASMLVALAFVVALAWGVLRLLRGRMLSRAMGGGGGDDEQLHFVRALPVGPKERVVLLDHRGERWMLGVTGGGISVLARWPVGAAPGGGAGAPGTGDAPSWERPQLAPAARDGQTDR